MALSNSRGPARRPKPSTPPAAPASPEPAAGAGAAEAPSARRAARRRAAPRRPARRGEDGIPFGLVRIGVIVAVLAIVGVIKLATAKPAGDAHYWHALVKFDEKMGRELFLMPGELRRRVNALPARRGLRPAAPGVPRPAAQAGGHHRRQARR
ncbi:MAG: hypothetical protein M5U26_25535 [Planctomycetota bacterium]|nr:hypothetical protein [Planctomycetota bacterium]